MGFQLLARLVDLQNEVDTLDPSNLAYASTLRELQQGESFLEYLIELQTEFGIRNFF